MSGASSQPRSTVFRNTSVPDNYERRLVPVLFAPWAEVLMELAGVGQGQAVLDVASGTGVVARAAARRVGPSGRVVASDISAQMLALAAAQDGAAAIEHVEASATELPFEDASFDVALCQHGWQFVADRAGAAAELRRVLRPGGVAAVAIWARGTRVEPFDHYNDALTALDVPSPYPMAYDSASFTMSPEEVEGVLAGAGFSEVDVRTQELEIVFPDVEAAADAILGTPFGPIVEELDPETRETLRATLIEAFGGDAEGAARRVSTATLGRALSPR